MSDQDVPVLVDLPDGTVRPAIQPGDPPFVRLRKTRDDDYTPEAVNRTADD